MIQENQTLLNRLNILADGILVFLSFMAGYVLRFYVLPGGLNQVPLRNWVLVGVMLIPIHLIINGMLGLYDFARHKRLYQDFITVFWANTLAIAALLMGFFLFKSMHFARWALALYYVIVNCTLTGKRVVTKKILRKHGKHQKTVLLIGSGKAAEKYAKEVQRSSELGYCILGYVSDRNDWEQVPYLGGAEQLGELLQRVKPDEAVAALDVEDYTQMPRIVAECEKSGTKLTLVPFYAEYMPAHPQIDSLNGLPLINLRRIPLDNLGNAFLKRAMDIVGSLVLIVLSSPIMLVAALGVKLSSPGPIIFKQKRVGLNKKEFYMYKFRSMRVNSEENTAWSTNRDNRKTKFGSFIRKVSVDELPQFFNVLKGEMSLVGPRPEIPHFVEQFKEEIPLYMVKHQVRPGITGWAQVNGLRGDTSIEERIRHDIFYIENWTLFMDIKILFMTLFKGVINQEQLR